MTVRTPSISPDPEEKPLVTFMLIAYKQEKYIREAVQGAFAQDYSPMEIILSDDCSPDSTYEIIQELAAGYSGPHKLILNRNEQNLNIGAHINRCVELASGELLVAAAGDDISPPHRTKILVDEWMKTEPRPTSLYSSYYVLDEENPEQEKLGQSETFEGDLLDLVNVAFAGVLGATHAWSREAFDVFGPMLPGTINEDCVIPFRSFMLGGIRKIEMPLVQYRNNNTSLSRMPHNRDQQAQDAVSRIGFEKKLSIYKNFIKDLQIARSNKIYEEEQLVKAIALAEARARLWSTRLDFLNADYLTRLKIAFSSTRIPIGIRIRWFIDLIAPKLLAYIRARRM